MTPRDLLTALFHAAVEAARPDHRIAAVLPQRPKGRTIVVGAGKGAAQLAQAVERAWPGGDLAGAVVTRYGYGATCDRIRVLEAAHLPDAAGLEASEVLFGLVDRLTKDDLVIALVCGGGSALLPAPPAGFDLADEQALNAALLKSGAPIAIMNLIRKHFSRIKGGRLAAAAYPARVVTLVVSDIPGDEPSLVSSGPTIASHGTASDALRAIGDWSIDLPDAVRHHFEQGENAPSPKDPWFAANSVHILASANVSLEAAAELARDHGIEAFILSDAIEGEAREAGAFHAAIAREMEARNRPFKTPALLLSGGETTVTVRGKGRGGRNTEFLLAFARSISGTSRIHALAADTDGIDGSEDNAGAFADGTSVSRMLAAGIRADDRLANNDAWTAFSGIDDLFVCGPTGTNVNDFRAILVT